MPSPYQEFARKARERFLAKQKQNNGNTPKTQSGAYCFTTHAQHKMRQYSLSVQKVRGVIRSPKRRQEGIAPRTIAVMQPIAPKIIQGKEIWKQEVWVMFQERAQTLSEQSGWASSLSLQQERFQTKNIKIISAWRYPGMSPKNQPLPAEILREIEEGSILEEEENASFPLS
ncbi:MAG: hypothetical protein KBC83_01585 [Candidatus Moranbacteria bacterium]|jgi:predicted HNH restriction endonuclease|nr:hypothetical protein [Candidatus Moranbacteria bacterium]MBP9801341.1 hypothetical protein [Candidatus Moranbacteria bacterium]